MQNFEHYYYWPSCTQLSLVQEAVVWHTTSPAALFHVCAAVWCFIMCHMSDVFYSGDSASRQDSLKYGMSWNMYDGKLSMEFT